LPVHAAKARTATKQTATRRGTTLDRRRRRDCLRRGCHPQDVTVTLCVLLWARAGREEALVAYEDAVLALVADHSGQVLQRTRNTTTSDEEPYEVHLLEFASEDALEAYMGDQRRAALAAERDAAIARTQVLRVSLLDPP